MDAEDLVIDNSSDREAVEALNELLPEFQRVATLALIVESINTIDGAAFVVSSEQEEVLRILDLVGE